MRKYLVLLLVLAIVAPSVVSWLPHDALHAVHDMHMAHHKVVAYQTSHDRYDEHQHVPHSHHGHDEASSHHPIQIDTISYFSDYLHIDLQQPNDGDLKLSEVSSKVFSFFALNNSHFKLIPRLESVQSRGPPFDFELHIKPNSLPVYLATQRFRV